MLPPPLSALIDILVSPNLADFEKARLADQLQIEISRGSHHDLPTVLSQIDSRLPGPMLAPFDNAVKALLRTESPSRVAAALVFLQNSRPSDTHHKRHRAAQPATEQSALDLVTSVRARYGEPPPSQDALVRAARFALVGSTSELLPLDRTAILVGLPPGEPVLRSILECSLLYVRLGEFCAKPQKSQVKVAFLAELLHRRQRFAQNINGLQASTIYELYGQISPFSAELRFLLFLAEKLEEPGDVFLGHIYSFSRFGDPGVKNIARDLFSSCSAPYLAAVQDWLLDGLLGSELFVVSTENGPELNAERYPTFLPSGLAQKIYETGKMLRFLRDVCREHAFLSAHVQRYRVGSQALVGGKAATLIQAQFDELACYLTKVLYSHRMDYHIRNLKKYMLLEQGDLADALLEDGLLDSPSNDVTGSQLATLLANCARQRCEKEAFQRLDARMLDSARARCAWERFTLDYALEVPVKAILFENGGLRAYLRLFNFIWRMKHACHALEANWRGVRRAGVLKDKCAQVRVAAHKMLAFVTRILSHITEVREVSYERMQAKLRKSERLFLDKGGAWDEQVLLPNKQYITKANAAVFAEIPPPQEWESDYEVYSLDEFVTLHQDFLKAIIGHKLVDNAKESSRGWFSGQFYVRQISEILALVERFGEAEKEFFALVWDSVSKAQLEDVSMRDETDPEQGGRLEKVVELITENIVPEFFERRRILVKDLVGDPELRVLGGEL